MTLGREWDLVDTVSVSGLHLESLTSKCSILQEGILSNMSTNKNIIEAMK